MSSFWKKNSDNIKNWNDNYKSSFKKKAKTFTTKNTKAVFLRNRLNQAIRNNQKSGIVVSNLGCSISQLKKYFEDQFKEGMTWDNWSRTGWHIDHIVPLSAVDLEIKEQLRFVTHWSNLRPVWAFENYHRKISSLDEFIGYRYLLYLSKLGDFCEK